MTMRAAGPADLDQVMAVERETFGDWEHGQRRAWSPTAWQADLDAVEDLPRLRISSRRPLR
mgnify:CR=1 FL=1